ncbi:glutathione S-transferase [Acidovorax sp. Leaf76]|uniref:glutathione S-transferase family protein n=1 Tax=unclassified Acidovorax TaxID=2684926 RepID=UPI0006F6642F|nr:MULTISPECIES: glutathione S-transferase family protein [unclassified Acidovorax]KQO23879.1 glutathione S-transferase [Acidovorax sp. Leaf76]KQO35667.1 glutathione S-transferase [Acidovorax sp. Leaf84]KQS39909.1 glutathione S-transferase [Acidovorax sp. Leaf191]
MIHLYHCVSARSFRPLWMLEELRLPYTLHMMPFPPRAKARWFLEENPLGTVPLLVQGEGTRQVRMTESAAICQYLAAAHPDAGLEVRPPDPAFGAYLNWLHLGEATLTFPQTLVLRYGRFEPAERKQPQVVEDYSRWFLARLRAVESAVARQDYLCAGRFTAADVSVGYALLLADHLGLEPQFGEATQAYWQRLQERPGYQRAHAAQIEAAEDQDVPTTPAPDTRP